MNTDTLAPSKNNTHNKRWLSVDFESLVSSVTQAQAKNELLAYDVVIVGSGYGGAIAAATLTKGRIPIPEAKSGEPTDRAVKLCVLERGDEYLPGSFPSKAAELTGHVRVAMTAQPQGIGNPQGLFDVRVGADACALVANGLGGGSLINGAVMLEPDFTAFDSKMPRDVELDLKNKYLREAKEMLGATRPSPNSTPQNVIQRENTIHLHRDVGMAESTQLDKTKVLRSLSSRQHPYQPAALTIEMQGNRPNGADVTLNACTLCGDCMTGCNVGARESLDTNLLVTAHKQGAEIYTGASVLRIEREEGKNSAESFWVLEVVYTNRALREREGTENNKDKPLRLRTRKLILAAGTFGSTEILLRSDTEKLHFSDRLGTQFSGNGDNLAALYKTNKPTNCVASETQPLNAPPGTPEARRVGPTITGMLKVPGDENGPGFVVQEFATPAPLKGLFEELLTTANLLHSLPQGDWGHHAPDALQTDPLAVNEEAVKHAMVLGLIGHDAADGRLRLARPITSRLHPSNDKEGPYEGQLQIDWPSAPSSKALDNAFERLTKIVQPQLSPLDGKLLPNPLWRALPKELDIIIDSVRGPVLSVHPLGGCPMGDSAATGVVNSYGQVYLPKRFQNEGDTTSLLVLDGAIVPGSLGANPSLTIAALSLRAAEHWQTAWGWGPKASPPQTLQIKAPLAVFRRPFFRQPEDCTSPNPVATEIQIIERLHGPIGSGLYAEVTFGFAPTPLKQLTQPMQRRLPTDPALRSEMPYVNRLRVFTADDWMRLGLNCADDPVREMHAKVIAELEGHLDLLGRESSSGLGRWLRAFWAYTFNRGFRDLARFVRDRKSGGDPMLCQLAKAIGRLTQVATHAGEVRYFNYAMNVTQLTKEVYPTGANNEDTRDWRGLIKVGHAVEGIKRFTYARRSNPWNQLLYLTLTRFPLGGVGLIGERPQLKLDARFLARQGVPLVRITKQENQPVALTDLARFGLFGARMFFSTHLWSFRKPDAPLSETPKRLPGSVKDLPPPEIREIELTHGLEDCTVPVRVRLTRYAQRLSEYPPLVLIHGFSASGTTFAHPALSPSMAGYFWRKGRDVWIVDLRTSPGMPTAKYPWSFEDVAWADIPVAIDHIVKQVTKELAAHVTGPALPAVQVDVFAHCIGAVMLSMALLTDVNSPVFTAVGNDGPRQEYQPLLRELPSHIHKVVLSQKSFALNYSDANVLRAYLMRFLRRLVLPENYSFRAPAFPGLRDKLMDLFLSALPYEKKEYDRENPPWWQFLKRIPWLTARHRMDALYEHTFNVNNMSDEVLEAIDDLFGPINTETIAQIIHFTRFNLITNKAGRSIFVSLAHLARWPKAGTLGIHNAENRMVDGNTLVLTEKWMNEAGILYQAQSIPSAAHQDGLIGLNAELTFGAVDAFLSAQPALPVNVNAALHRLHKPRLGKPWLGPRIHRLPNGDLELWVGAHPGYASSAALLIPVSLENDRYVVLETATPSRPAVALNPSTQQLAMNLQSMVSSTALNLSSGVLAVVYYANCLPADWAFP